MMTTSPRTAKDYPETVGVILAGGLARRLGGGDKPLRLVDGRPILERVIERIRPQCSDLILNANGDPARFAAVGLPVIADAIEGYVGPLAGVLTALDWVALNRPGVQWLLTSSGDCPFLPRDLAVRMHKARDPSAYLIVAASGGRTHPVIALWSTHLREHLKKLVVDEGERKVTVVTERLGAQRVEWPVEPFDPFFNVNTEDDLGEADRLAKLDDQAST